MSTIFPENKGVVTLYSCYTGALWWMGAFSFVILQTRSPDTEQNSQEGLLPEEISAILQKKTTLKEKEASCYAQDLFSLIHGSKKRLSSLKSLTKLLCLLPDPAVLTEVRRQVSKDQTTKLLYRLNDENTIESVLIPDSSRNSFTACISSQVGCAVGCKFCLSTKSGLIRNLRACEIVGQIHRLGKIYPITHIVFMGMGEPLHNFSNVIQACKILIHPSGLNYSRRKITVSTSGIRDKITLLGTQVAIRLAVSLNAPNDTIREKIMPITQKYPLSSLLEACRQYPLRSGERILFEYVLLKGINDQEGHAIELAKKIQNIPCKVNLIAYNDHGYCDFKTPDPLNVLRFQKILHTQNISASLRTSRGQDILAACGQLRNEI